MYVVATQCRKIRTSSSMQCFWPGLFSALLVQQYSLKSNTKPALENVSDVSQPILLYHGRGWLYLPTRICCLSDPGRQTRPGARNGPINCISTSRPTGRPFRSRAAATRRRIIHLSVRVSGDQCRSRPPPGLTQGRDTFTRGQRPSRRLLPGGGGDGTLELPTRNGEGRDDPEAAQRWWSESSVTCPSTARCAVVPWECQEGSGLTGLWVWMSYSARRQSH